MQFRMSADGVLETGSVGFDRETTAAFNLTIQVKDGTATTSPRYTVRTAECIGPNCTNQATYDAMN